MYKGSIQWKVADVYMHLASFCQMEGHAFCLPDFLVEEGM